MNKKYITGRRVEIFKTIGTNLILQLVTAICGFILPPLIVKTFGSEINGMVASISQFIAYLNIVEAGIGAASIAALYKPLADKDFDSINGILSATRKFYARSGIFFVLLIFLLSIIYPFLIGKQTDRFTSGLMVLILGIPGAAEFFLIGKYNVLLTADKKFYILSLIQILATIVNTFIAVILIELGFYVLLVKFVSALVFLSRYFFIVIYVKRNYKNLSFDYVPNNEAIGQSKNVLIHKVSGLIVFNSPLVLITIFCSLKDASIYTMYAMVFTAVNQILGAFSGGIQSFFGESLVTESEDKTKRLFGLYESFYFIVLFFLYSMSYIFITPFMSLYTKNLTDALYVQPKLGLLFVIIGIANNLRLPCGQMIDAAGHFKSTQLRAIIEGIINLIASIFFTIKYGFYGVLIGGLFSYAYRTIDIIVYSNRKILNRSFILSFIKITVLLFGFGILSSCIKSFLPEIYTFKDWILYATICSVIFIIPCGLFILYIIKRRDIIA